MKIEDIRLCLTRYKFEQLQLMVPDQEPFQIDRQFVGQFIIEKDFENYFSPFFQITLGIPNFLYRAMKKNPNKSKLKMELRAGKYYDYEIMSEDQTPMTTKLSGEFICYFPDTSPDLNEELQESIEKDYGTFGQGYMYSDIVNVDILLYKEEYLQNARKVINYVVSSGTLTDMVTICCNDGGFSKVLMSPAQNNRSYKEFCITPIQIQKQLHRICNSYGIHTAGTIIFFDFDTLYILDKAKKCTAFVKNEYKTTYISSFQGSLKYTLLSGSYSDSKEKYNLLQIESDSLSIISQESGENFILIDTKGGTTTQVSDAENFNGVKDVFVINQGDDTSKAYGEALKERKLIMNVGFNCPDLDYLKPNKHFQFISDDPKTMKYNGDYRLTRYVCVFDKEGEYLCPKVSAEFRS